MCFNILTNATGFAFLPFLVVSMLICLNPFSSTCWEISHLVLGAKRGDRYISTEQIGPPRQPKVSVENLAIVQLDSFTLVSKNKRLSHPFSQRESFIPFTLLAPGWLSSGWTGLSAPSLWVVWQSGREVNGLGSQAQAKSCSHHSH